MIVNTFKDMINSKQNLSDLQKKWEEDLVKTYPYMETKSIQEITRNLIGEIEICLSSSVKNKSGRFTMESRTGWGKEVILSRVPGLKRPHESHVATNFDELVSIDENDYLYFSERGRNEKYIKLGNLKNEGKINQEKLSNSFEYLRSFLKIKKELDQEIHDNPRYHDKNFNFKVGEYSLVLREKHFSLIYFDKDGDDESWESENMVNYYYKENYRSMNLQEEIKVVDCYSEIHKGLLKLENKKRILVNKLEGLLKILKVENRSFRILQKLSN